MHALILMGSWQMATSPEVRQAVRAYAIQLKNASVAMVPSLPKVVSVPKKTAVKPLVQESAPAVRPETQAVSAVSSSGLAANVKADLRAIYQTELRGEIEKNKFYPPVSRRLGHTGLVIVAFTLLEDGNIIDVRIDRPSDYERLNDSALEAVKKIGKFKPIPKELGESQMSIRVPVKFFTI